MVCVRWLVVLVFLVVAVLLLDSVDGQSLCFRSPFGRRRQRWWCPPQWTRSPDRMCCFPNPPPPPPAGSCEANAEAWCECVSTQLSSADATDLLPSFSNFETLRTALNALTPTTCGIDPSDSAATTLAECPDVLTSCLNKFGSCRFLPLLCEAAGDPSVTGLADGDTQIAAATADVPKLCLYYKTFQLLPNAAVAVAVASPP